MTPPLIDISMIYVTLLPWPSSNLRWECDISLPDAAGCQRLKEELAARASSLNSFSSACLEMHLVNARHFLCRTIETSG